jgi:hypothetical protein
MAVRRRRLRPSAVSQTLGDLREGGASFGETLAFVGVHRGASVERSAQAIELRRQILAFVDDKGKARDRSYDGGPLVEGRPVIPAVLAARCVHAVPLGKP